MTMLPHCILGGEPVNKAANSEPEQVAAAVAELEAAAKKI